MRRYFSSLLTSWQTGKLKKRYLELHPGSRKEAEHTWERQLKVLKQKRPGYPEKWYSEKVLYDLERDRR